MNKSLMLSLAWSAMTLAGLGGPSMASAQQSYDYGHHSNGSWRNDGAHTADFAGMWRLESPRGNAGGWNNGRNGRGGDDRGGWNFQRAQLPEVIQIERDRREIRVENQNGQLLRRTWTGRRRDRNDGSFQVESSVRGARVTEVFSLQSGGRELVVRTTIEGPRGSRQFTSVYDRA